MKGIDTPIESMVTRFTSNLWTGKDRTFRGRIFRNVKDEGTFPEWYNATTERYEDVLLDKFVDATCFFDVQPSETYSGYFISEVWICFSVNLKTLYPTVSGRQSTEYAHKEIIDLIERDGRFKITGLVRGLPAFADYTLVKESDNMNNFYLFRINTEVRYPINC
jgi:hypothetical protein